MKKSILITIIAVFTISFAFAQKSVTNTTYSFPSKGDAIIKYSVPTANWNVTDENNLLSLTPKGSGETSRLITMIWASENPYAEDAMTVIVNDAFDVIETLLTDLTWQENMNTFENNGISFTALDGFGYYVNEDGSRDRMSASIMILIPDEINILTLLFFATDQAYDKLEKELLDIILSITPAK